jgi:[acyl-carrier-protein] S-malonyltransferase
MKIAFMFPGQGTQYPDMGKDIYEEYEEARNIYDRASKILNIDMKKLCFEASKEELSKTENTQIAIAVTSLATLEVLRKYGIEADICTGLSLGEYVALMYAEVLSLEDGLNLLKQRGYYMGNFVPNEDFSMSAVIGMDSSKIEDICKELQQNGLFVVPANYNYSMQTVISGNKDAVEQASSKLKELGAKKVIALNTSGPFHTEKLEKAKELYKVELEKVSFEKGKKVVIKNIDGRPYLETDNIQEILAKHIVSPVRFDKSIQYMKEHGVDTFIEIGPGKALSGFVKKELKDFDISCFNTDSLEGLLNILENCI